MTPGRWNLIFIIICLIALFGNSLGIEMASSFSAIQSILSCFALICACILFHGPNYTAWVASSNAGTIDKFQWIYRVLLSSTGIFLIIAVIFGFTRFSAPSDFPSELIVLIAIGMYIFGPVTLALILWLPFMREQSCTSCDSIQTPQEYQIMTNGGPANESYVVTL